ncbi:uncharacterized protein ATNIH1004_007044 [Aspergillus tanneri]|uniref:Uncharacterized protein n=1 Tax=Aspergillus tanneri TaxID=1220188 RepID=A0A5M9MF73_9EURO|nr:uncharacterized protein ATNIH1004_007044 [Aspergillus tanneri]KAA8645625.1 hypothetical protein ATNIH1004_007044 [Aspergillus tanneri]
MWFQNRAQQQTTSLVISAACHSPPGAPSSTLCNEDVTSPSEDPLNPDRPSTSEILYRSLHEIVFQQAGGLTLDGFGHGLVLVTVTCIVLLALLFNLIRHLASHQPVRTALRVSAICCTVENDCLVHDLGDLIDDLLLAIHPSALDQKAINNVSLTSQTQARKKPGRSAEIYGITTDTYVWEFEYLNNET